MIFLNGVVQCSSAIASDNSTLLQCVCVCVAPLKENRQTRYSHPKLYAHRTGRSSSEQFCSLARPRLRCLHCLMSLVNMTWQKSAVVTSTCCNRSRSLHHLAHEHLGHAAHGRHNIGVNSPASHSVYDLLHGRRFDTRALEQLEALLLYTVQLRHHGAATRWSVRSER